MKLKELDWKMPIALAWTIVKHIKITTIKTNGVNSENKYETIITSTYKTDKKRNVVAHYKSARKAHIGHIHLVNMYLGGIND